MTSSALPKKPVENWEQIRDEWVSAVDGLIRDAEEWSQRQDWASRRSPKVITDDPIGPYTVPQLLIQGTFGRLLLDPVTRFVPGATGLIDLYVIPSYDAVLIVRTDKGWHIHLSVTKDERRPWSEEAFVETALQLGASA
jgi:hypothetical protein